MVKTFFGNMARGICTLNDVKHKYVNFIIHLMKFIDLKYFFHITRSCNRTHGNQQAPLEQRVPWDLLDLSTALDASRLYESSYSSYSDKPLLVATLTVVRKNSHSLNFGWQFATLLVFRGSI